MARKPATRKTRKTATKTKRAPAKSRAKKTAAKNRTKKAAIKAKRPAKRKTAKSKKTTRKRSKKTVGAKEAALRSALREHIRVQALDYLDDPEITSVGVARDENGKLCLQFTVEEMSAAGLESLKERKIPEKLIIGGEEIATNVVKRSYKPSFELVSAETLGDRRLRRDPIQPGISVGHVKETAGTIGMIVYDRITGAPCILSNWHVLHGNEGVIGDEIVQPGPFDDNNVSGNFTGNLLRSHLGAAGDCAIARIRTRDFDREIMDLDVAPAHLARVDIGDRVIKSGRTTGVTHGVVRRVDVMAKINYGLPAGVKAIGCFEIGVDQNNRPSDGEISRPGDSGSVWVIGDDDGPTDIFAGLHFGGESASSTDEHALACYPLSVQKKLDFVLEPPVDELPGDEELEVVVPRAGYDPDFLGVNAPMPGMSTAIKRDAVNFGRKQTIPYTHFSVCLSARRKMARFVAWNVDGAQRVVRPRLGFRLDPRVESKHQHGEELYSNNPLDRGHIARRADLAWGSVAEATQANRDSFFFTNIAPQHERFNQSSRKGLWGELENLILEQADVQDIRISVMGGPVFADDDPDYRGAKIPQSFWKLVAYLGDDDILRVSVFMLSQTDLLQDIETLDLDPFRIFQITVSDLSARTELDFSDYESSDVLANPELATAEASLEALLDNKDRMKEISHLGDVVF